MQRLAIDDVVRNLRDELRCERVERFRIFAMRQPVAFQRAGNAGQINAGLISRQFSLQMALMAGNNINA